MQTSETPATICAPKNYKSLHRMKLEESKNQEILSKVGASEISGRCNQLKTADFREKHE